MTQEEKAKAYDEAIERAEAFNKRWQCIQAIDSELALKELKEIFPELKESEDEKIKRMLIDYFKEYKENENCGINTFNRIPTDNILSWLEKQGEEKSYGQRKECLDCQFNYAGECKGSCQMKRGEQKFADKVEPKFKVEKIKQGFIWSKEDEENFRDIIGAIHAVAYQTTEDEEARLKWLYAIKQRIGG